MVVTTMSALVYKLFADYIPGQNYLLIVIDVISLLLAVGVMRLSIMKLVRPQVAPRSSF